MPVRIEDVFPDLAFSRNATKLSVGDVTKGAYLSPLEQARLQTERARSTLNSGGISIDGIIRSLPLDASVRDRLSEILANGGANAQDLRSVILCECFRKLTKPNKAKVLRLFLADQRTIVLMFVHDLSTQLVSEPIVGKILDRMAAGVELLDRLVDTGVFQRHPLAMWLTDAVFEDKAEKVLEVFSRLGSVSKREMIELCRYWYILFDRTLGIAGDSNATIDILFNIVTGGIDQLFTDNGIVADDVVRSVIRECLDPGQVDQSSRGTCTVTSMQYVLCRQNPAEYARVMAGLVGSAAAVDVHSARLTRVDDSVPPDRTARSVSERVFQSSLMQYARGQYSNTSPSGAGPGLHTDEEEKALEALFGENFEVIWGVFPFWASRGNVILSALRNRGRLTRTFSSLDWGNGGHFVFLTEVANGRVFFRNPWGLSDPAGTVYSNPPRIMEDPSIDLESMAETDYRDNVRAIIWPQLI